MTDRICDILGAPGGFEGFLRKRQKEGILIMNTTSEEVRNPELLKAMRAMLRENTEKTRGHMAAVLMNSRLLSPIEQQTVLTEREGPSTRIRFEDIRNEQGDKYYLAFTDMDEYAKWNKEENHNQALIMTMEDFGNILIRHISAQKGFVINPYGENVSISKELLLSLLKQREAREHASEAN